MMGMNQIVKGLRYHYTTDQLREQMLGRAKHHELRAEQKEKALPELKRAVETVKANAQTQENTELAMMIKTSANYHFAGGNQVEALETDIRDHRNKALVFKTLADHLVPHATYDLDENDLRRLEIVK
jgi:hypothetical protein